MAAPPSLLPLSAAVLVACLTAVAPDARSASAQHTGWLDGGWSQYNLAIRGDNGNHYGWYKKDKKKNRPRNDSVVVSEPPMIVLFGTALLVAGFVAWRKRRKS